MVRRVEVAAAGPLWFAALAALDVAEAGAAMVEPPLEKWLGWLRPPGPWRSDSDTAFLVDLPTIDVAPPADGEGPWAPAEVTAGVDPAAVPAAPEANPLPGILRTGDCVVEGEVSDVTTLEPIAGAIVTAMGTGREDETDSEGRFRIAGLPEGEITLEALKLGYSSGTAVVILRNGTVGEARIALRVKPQDSVEGEYLLPAESIVGEYTESNQGDFNLDLDLTTTTTSGISKAEFSQKGISDAAGAVGKISGANIVGGKFAVVRGLADRYVTTLFNGAAISSADPSRKAVQLDIFPTVALQGIDIAKTYDPSLPGDFGGGTIKIKSLSIPEERIAEFKYKMTWNSNLEDRMLVNGSRELGFWGDVDNPIPDSWVWNTNAAGDPVSFNSGGNRVVPGANNRNPTQQQAQIAIGRQQQALANGAVEGQRALHSSQSFMPQVVRPEEAHSMSLVYGDRIEFEDGGILGFMTAFQHGTSDEVNAPAQENRLTSPARSWTEESYAREVDWSFYASAGYKPNDNHDFNATYFRKRIATDAISHGTNFEIAGSEFYGGLTNNAATINRYGASAVYKKEFWVIDPIIRDTELMQLGGQHKNDSGTKLGWSLTSSVARESRPHSSTFQNGILDFADPRVAAEAAVNPDFIYNPSLGQISTLEYQTFVEDLNGSQDSSRETQFIEENGLEASLDLTQSIWLTDEEEDGPRIDLAFGGSQLTKDREQSGRIYLLRTSSWERWITRNLPAWWPSDIAPFSPSSPLSGTLLPDGSPLPAGFASLGEYLARNPDKLVDYFNGYGTENAGGIPGTGTAATRANFVFPDAPYYLNGSGLEVRNVGSDLSLTGLYTSATFHGDFWRLGGGARWEEEVKSYEVAAAPLTRLAAGDPSRFGTVTTDALIPSVQAGLDLSPDKSWLTFAWSRTVARPTFHEFLPIESIDQSTGIIRRGNSNLTETSIENIDASLDYVFSDSFNGRISLFHKNLIDPIVVVQQVDQGVNSTSYINGDRGSITGFELEASWKQENGPFSLTGNYTFIDSTLNYQVNQGINVTDLETRFPFQPGQILNATFGWAPEDLPWSAFLTANFTDEYPTLLRSEPSAYDVWLNPQFTLDLVVARKFELEHFDATMTFGFRNLLGGTREYEYRGGGVNGAAGQFDGLSYTLEEPGRSFSVEFKAAF
ncbi:MAG: TonB-dependent receptor [Akkermansiaceae bacterium]|nr:TonB-dependent receptor [Akkermansiaceae bacterium]